VDSVERVLGGSDFAQYDAFIKFVFTINSFYNILPPVTPVMIIMLYGTLNI